MILLVKLYSLCISIKKTGTPVHSFFIKTATSQYVKIATQLFKKTYLPNLLFHYNNLFLTILKHCFFYFLNRGYV